MIPYLIFTSVVRVGDWVGGNEGLKTYGLATLRMLDCCVGGTNIAFGFSSPYKKLKWFAETVQLKHDVQNSTVTKTYRNRFTVAMLLKIIEATTDREGNFLLFNEEWFMLFNNRKEGLVSWLQNLHNLSCVIEINQKKNHLILHVVNTNKRYKIKNLYGGLYGEEGM